MIIKIMVATHKKYRMPQDDIYLPIQVGAQNKNDIGFIKDNTGDNISLRNPYYCELTALYWGWKNLNVDYIGLVHYRRHFLTLKRKNKDKFKNILDKSEIEGILKDVDIILPKKRNYIVESVYSHYKHTLHIETLDETRNIIKEKYPDYLTIFDKNMKKNSAHMFNMFIGKKIYIDKYCEWLFDILFELEKRIDPQKYNDFHARYLGRISELLLDVWLDKNKLQCKEISVLNIEKINWFNKFVSFIFAKFFNKKYQKSF